MKLGTGAGLLAALVLSAASGWAQSQAPAPAQPAPAPAEPDAPPPEPGAPPAGLDPALEPGAPAVSLDAEPSAQPVRPRPTAAPPPPAPASNEPQPDPVVPFASDTLAGQIQLGVSGLFSLPFGELARNVAAFPTQDVGFGAAVDGGFGIARHVVLGVYGEFAAHGAASACTDCSSTALSAGAFVRYHLVQGLRFDPWISYGLGYRGVQVTSPTGNADYSGIEWLRLQFGGDWYALPQLGLGPFVELAAASLPSVPDTERAGGVSWRFQSGLRIVLDLPGR